MFFKNKFDEILKRLNFVESKIEEREDEKKTEEVKRRMIDQEIEDNEDYPSDCYDLLFKYTSNGKIEINGYQRYRLLSIIAMDQETAFKVLTSFYFTPDANERIMLLSALLNDKIEENDRYNYLLELINAKDFIFTSFEMIMVVSYIVQFEAWELINPLTKKYSIPQNLRDLLNSRAVLDSLIKEK